MPQLSLKTTLQSTTRHELFYHLPSEGNCYQNQWRRIPSLSYHQQDPLRSEKTLPGRTQYASRIERLRFNWITVAKIHRTIQSYLPNLQLSYNTPHNPHNPPRPPAAPNHNQTPTTTDITASPAASSPPSDNDCLSWKNTLCQAAVSSCSRTAALSVYVSMASDP